MGNGDQGHEDPKTAPEFLPGWWRYVRGPGAYLANLDLGTRENGKRGRRHLIYGLLGVLAFSAVNVRLSPSALPSDAKATFESRVPAYALLQACIVFALAVHAFVRASGRCARTATGGSLREAVTGFSLAYSYIWPSVAVGLIAIAWQIRWTLGLDWMALPPFVGRTAGGTTPSFATAAFGALAAAMYLWLIGWIMYGYARTTMRIYRIPWWWALGANVGVVGAFYAAEALLAPIFYKVAETLDPLISWILKILG